MPVLKPGLGLACQGLRLGLGTCWTRYRSAKHTVMTSMNILVKTASFYLESFDIYGVLKNIHFFSPLFISHQNQMNLEMWADAQRDGRPAKYRWRPLFNAAKFG